LLALFFLGCLFAYKAEVLFAMEDEGGGGCVGHYVYLLTGKWS